MEQLNHTIEPETPRIDPRLIPTEDYTTGCRILAAGIRHALADPETRAEYEEWKKRRLKATSSQ